MVIFNFNDFCPNLSAASLVEKEQNNVEEESGDNTWDNFESPEKDGEVRCG